MAQSRTVRKLWYSLSLGGALLWCLIGASGGIGAYTFYYAEGASYLSNDPHSCANCHVMQGHLDAWHKSSHKSVATCNDCHAPHGSFLAKYYCKGRNGFFHSLAFTTDRFPDQIRINDYNRRVTESACRYCHAKITETIDHATLSGGEEMSCIRCHSDVGHAN